MRSRSGGTSAKREPAVDPARRGRLLYVVDQWGVLYKIDARSGDMGRIVWRMDPARRSCRCRTAAPALWGQSGRHHRELSAARHRHQQGDRARRLGGQPFRRPADVQLTAAPLAVKDKIVLGAAGGDRGTRDFIVALDAATGTTAWHKYVIPAPGEARLGNLEGQEQRMADRRRRHVGDGLL